MPTSKRARTIVKLPPRKIKSFLIHQLKSQKVKSRKRPIVVGLSLATNEEQQKSALTVKATTMVSRTGLKQELMREQVENEKKRKAQNDILAQSVLSLSLPSSAIISVPQRMSNVSFGVPKQVLKVETKLENPTRYHVQENQKRQISQFLTNIQGIQSVPPELRCNDTRLPHHIVNSCDPSPNSPHSIDPSSSTTTTSEWGGLWDGLTNTEGEMDTDLDFIRIESGTVPLPTSLSDILGYSSETYGKGSTSCPSDLPKMKEEPFSYMQSDLQTQVLDKDRQKKDNHNMIERRRRFNINDRIKELGTLLPRNCDPYYELVKDQRQNKGTILKATVDYLRQLKKDVQKIQVVEERNRFLEQQNKKLYLRVQEMEVKLQNHGISVKNSTWQPSNTADLSAIMQEPPILSTESYTLITSHLLDAKFDCSSPSSGRSSAPSASPAPPCNSSLDEYLIDDDIDDPLLSSQSLRKGVCFADTLDLMS